MSNMKLIFFFYQEKYRQYIKGKKNQFDKQYNLLCTYYDND